MKIIIAPDSFKESLDALSAAQAIAAGVKSVLPKAEIVLLPVADGGEGTVIALVTAKGGTYLDSEVEGPMGAPVSARWGLLPDGTAVMEMAAAAGLPLVPPPRRNPLLASTFGVGQLILAALGRGCKSIILGLGGSATCDGGAGALAALGAVMLDKADREIAPNPQGLLSIHRLDISNLDQRLAETEIVVASDVENPLLGPRGAAVVFGPQKGANEAQVRTLEKALRRLATVAKSSLGADIASFPGSGAAGGLAAGLSMLSAVRFESGIDLVLDKTGFFSHLEGADLIITGEGRIDGQSAMGKALAGLAKGAKGKGIPLIALCGAVGPGYQEVYSLGVTAVQPIQTGTITLAESLARTGELLSGAAAKVLRTVLAGGCQ